MVELWVPVCQVEEEIHLFESEQGLPRRLALAGHSFPSSQCDVRDE